jgi:hypothetical protein
MPLDILLEPFTRRHRAFGWAADHRSETARRENFKKAFPPVEEPEGMAFPGRAERPRFIVCNFRSDKRVPAPDRTGEDLQQATEYRKEIVGQRPSVISFQGRKSKQHPGGCDCMGINIEAMKSVPQKIDPLRKRVLRTLRRRD